MKRLFLSLVAVSLFGAARAQTPENIPGDTDLRRNVRRIEVELALGPTFGYASLAGMDNMPIGLCGGLELRYNLRSIPLDVGLQSAGSFYWRDPRSACTSRLYNSGRLMGGRRLQPLGIPACGVLLRNRGRGTLHRPHGRYAAGRHIQLVFPLRSHAPRGRGVLEPPAPDVRVFVDRTGKQPLPDDHRDRLRRLPAKSRVLGGRRSLCRVSVPFCALLRAGF